MRQFYINFEILHALRGESQTSKIKIVSALRSQLTWTHYRLILQVESKGAKEFYIKESIENNWSTRQLERQINSSFYERLLLSKNKKGLLKHTNNLEKQQDIRNIIKDPYVLDFIGIDSNNKFIESDLEKGIIDNLQSFLLELGKGFAFIGRQQRINVDGDNFYVDLVFYNYILNCFLLIDLKIGKLTPQDIGQMDFYVRYYETEIKKGSDNPTIGLILCTEKNENIVKYTILGDKKHIFASKYKLYLPSEKELKKELEKERNRIGLK
jgi:predicted nuclease of restriction endonuclease-like (RecB) superfamily